MIYELDMDKFHQVKPLLVGELINHEVKAIVEGFNPGWVFVDSLQSPKTALVWSKGIQGFYFIGDADNIIFNSELNSFIDNDINPRLVAMGLDFFEFSGTSDSWDSTLKRVFDYRKPSVSTQFVYKHESLQNNSLKEQASDEFNIKKIDAKLLSGSFDNASFLKGQILDWWNSIDDFLNDGMGYCIITDELVLSSCITSFRSLDTIELHIVTHEAYRKKGLASIAVAKMLEYCRDNCYSAYWDCMETNYGSRALAEKMGFTKAFEYTLYDFKLNNSVYLMD